jgi:mycothiol S-conjugate amidase
MSLTILSLHAHPDDESSKGAATVAKLVDEGARAVLVTATGGEAGEILNPAMDTPDIISRLTQVRAHELRVAADIIGYNSVEMLGYRDSGMPDSVDNERPEAFCNQDFEQVLERVVAIVRRERPSVVLGYDAHEFYPHPDHLRIHELTVNLVGAAADARRFPHAGEPWKISKVYAPIFTSSRIRALHEAMLERTGESPFAGWLDRLDGYTDPERRTMRYDVTGYIDRGRDALRAHRTQVDPDGFWFKVPTDVVESVYPWEDFELMYTDRPWNGEESDLFAGVDL